MKLEFSRQIFER